MPSFAVRQVALCFPLILGSLPLAAQSSSYYLEFESQSLVLVNDSEKVIEAYSVRQPCARGAQLVTVILGSAHQSTQHRSLGGSGVIEPGERRNLGGGWIYRPDDHSCDALLEAVIFTDGSFGGKEAAVRSLKAQGDGTAASVHYWLDRIKGQNPDGSTLTSLLDEIKWRIAVDRRQLGQPAARLQDGPPPALWGYWFGRREEDQSLQFRFQREWSAMRADEALHRAKDYMAKRKADIGGDEGLQKLSTAFPPVSEP